MADYIDRETVCREIDRFTGYLDEDMIYRIKFALERLPAADVVERKRGEWNVRIFGRDGTDTYCSVCGRGGNRPYWNFCPNCGANMRHNT